MFYMPSVVIGTVAFLALGNQWVVFQWAELIVSFALFAIYGPIIFGSSNSLTGRARVVLPSGGGSAVHLGNVSSSKRITADRNFISSCTAKNSATYPRRVPGHPRRQRRPRKQEASRR